MMGGPGSWPRASLQSPKIFRSSGFVYLAAMDRERKRHCAPAAGPDGEGIIAPGGVDRVEKASLRLAAMDPERRGCAPAVEREISGFLKKILTAVLG
ncbi:MAG: hypothetical protein JXR73_07045 [Candidatus Omnitrophica bacterium]|nr:hypothetical protein [Candidatus Omnitrophota bacterium]